MGRGAAFKVGAAVAVSMLGWVPGAATAAQKHTANPATITLHASHRFTNSGDAVVLSGIATDPAATAPLVVDLYKRPYPWHTLSLVRTATVSSGGTFRFTVNPETDANYKAVIAGTKAQASVGIHVFTVTYVTTSAISLGRGEVKIVLFHPTNLFWGKATMHWWFASGNGPFQRAPDTRAYRLSPHVIVIRTTATLPAGRFSWRVCFHAPGDRAIENPGDWKGCSGRGYSGRGFLPVGFPGPGAIARAESYLQSTGGITGMAVVDSEGRISGYNLNTQFITGSVVKAMLLVAYLRRLDSMGQHYIDSYSNSFLYPMINVSDNNAATQTWSIVGNAGLYEVAGAAGMTNFSVTTDWGSALLTPADQAHFFFEMDSLIPPEFVGYARNLFSTIAAYESWGIPAIARPLGYNVFFKGGWRPSPNTYLVNQIARLEGHGVTFSMAIMTDGDAGMGDGISKIEGTTSALLG